jgi:P4 family phage/plasmid primase-like protien
MNQLTNDHLKYLLERGINESLISSHSINYYNIKKSKLQLDLEIPGINFSYFDFDKNIIAHRLRPLASDWEKAITLRDYYLKEDGELPKFLTGKKQKPHAYFSPLLDWHKIAKKTNIDLIITEGETRAILLASHDIPCVGLPGVNGVSSLDKLLPDLEQIDWKNRNVSICFDSDIIQKEPVKFALLKLCKKLFPLGAKLSITLLPNEICGSKNGIDDFIVRHGINAFQNLEEEFKILSKTKFKILENKIIKNVEIDPVTQEKTTSLKYESSLNSLEPHTTVKSAMVWSILKDRFDYHPILHWLYWNDKYWEVVENDVVLGTIEEIRKKNNWITNNTKEIYERFQWKLSTQKTNWFNEKYLGFENGYLNTETNEFVLPFREARLTSILPFDYDSSAQCPQWLEFLDSAFHLEDTKEYLKAWFRWILAPKPNNRKFDLEATLWLVGKSGYGKSTVLETLKNLVGENSFGNLDITKLDNNNTVFNLVGKKIAINNDATGFIKELGKYNSICSNEEVMVWNKHHNEFPTRLGCVPVLAMNTPLGFSGADSSGLTRRLHILKFTRPPQKIDCQLDKKLKAEIAGIFAWAWSMDLESAIHIIKKNKDSESFEEVFEENMTEYQFLYENYLNGGTYQSSVLLQNYQKWAEAKGFKPSNRNKFAQALMNRLNIERIKNRDGYFYNIPDLEKVSLTELLKGNFEKAEQQTLFEQTPLFGSLENQSVTTVMTRDDPCDDPEPLLNKGGDDCDDGLDKNFSSNFISSSSSSDKNKENVITVITPLPSNEFTSSPPSSQVITVVTNDSDSQLDDICELGGFTLYEEVLFLPYGEVHLRQGVITSINKESESFEIFDNDREVIEYCSLNQIEKIKVDSDQNEHFSDPNLGEKKFISEIEKTLSEAEPYLVVRNIFGDIETQPYKSKESVTVSVNQNQGIPFGSEDYQESLELYHQIQAKIKEIGQNKGFLENSFAMVTFENFLTFSENLPLNKKEHLEVYYQWLNEPKNQVIKQTTLNFSEKQENSKFSQEHLIETIKSLPTNGKNNSSKRYECPNCQKSKLWLNEKKGIFGCHSCGDGKSIYRELAQLFNQNYR